MTARNAPRRFIRLRNGRAMGWNGEPHWALAMAERAAITQMSHPVECCKCGAVYDLGKIEVTGHYLDCTMWRTPCCRATVDDRGNFGGFGQPAYQDIPRPPRRGDGPGE